VLFFSGLTSRRIAASFPHSQLALLASAFVASSHTPFRKSPGSFKEIQNGLELGFKPVTSLGHGLQQPGSSPFTANARLRCI
jgi:hypothetical protein